MVTRESAKILEGSVGALRHGDLKLPKADKTGDLVIEFG
jgi:hypothetical protein